MLDAPRLAPDAPLPWAPELGPDRCFVIAEAGVNHNGDVQLARQLVDAAVEAGADAVKFQTWTTEELVAPGAPLAAYQADAVEAASQFEMLKRLELPHEAFRELQAHARDRGILFVSTPDDEASADFLEELDVPFFKLGSPEVTNLRLLRHVARKGRPVVLSTGMSELDEVRRAVATVEAEGARELLLLHCVSAYPAPVEDANLRAMLMLREEFGVPVGFSDHTLGTAASLAAVALGARVLERHLTLDRSLEGPDHAASLDPEGLRALIAEIRDVERALGDGAKRILPSERNPRASMQRVLVARTDLAPGARVAEHDLALLRAGAGIDAADIDEVVGRELARSVAAGTVLSRDMLR